MARRLAFAAVLVFAAQLACAQQANSTVDAPLVDYFKNLNSSTYSTFWLALEAGNLDQYLNNSDLAITIFAPTNDAWLKRLPTLTNNNGITAEQLFSQSKSPALQSMLQYHMLQSKKLATSFVSGDYLSTLSNLCSDAKTLQIVVNKGGSITLNAAGGTRPNLLDKGLAVGKSIVYAVDDMLLPSVVTIPLSVALQNFNATSLSLYTPVVAAQSGVIDNLQQQTVNQAPAPIYVQPATPPQTATPAATGTGGATPTGTAAAPTAPPASPTPKASPKATPTPTPTPAAGGIDTGAAPTPPASPTTGR